MHAPRVAFRCREVVGEKWALLPSAAGVIDPLLSTGFPLTLLGVARLLDILETTVLEPQRRAALAAYERTTQEELDVTEQLVGALYACMADPALFKRLSLLYFAAASYSETVRRLGRPHLAPGFLLNEHPHFGAELRDVRGARRCGSGRRRTEQRSSTASTAPSIPSIPRASSIARAAIGTRSSPPTSSPAHQSSRRQRRMSIVCWSGADL